MADQLAFTAELLNYARDMSLREDEVLLELREFTATLPGGPTMQVTAEEGQLLALLVGLTGARTVLEIGTFTGYSTLCMARALPADGRLTTCDIFKKWPRIGLEYWDRAGVTERIDLRIGDALDVLGDLAATQGESSFDFAFIDADKVNYVPYYEATYRLVRPGGVIVVDNTLYLGRVVNDGPADAETTAIRDLNVVLRNDDRIELSILPMADGITLIRKKEAAGDR
jgi:O-methyltransferase